MNNPICSGCKFETIRDAKECAICVQDRLAGNGSHFVGRNAIDPAITAVPHTNTVWTVEMMERLAEQEQGIASRRVRGIDAQHENAVPDPSATIQGVGAKNDAGKPRAGLMVKDFARALAAISHVSTMGVAKYSAGSWKTIPNAKERYYDALHRHILADAAGEVNDPESGLPHLAHAAWNNLALLELALTEAKK